MKTKAKGQPLSVQQWMVEFLTDVISSSSSATVEPGTDGGNKTASLAHFLLGVVLSKGHGEWTFTAETKSMEHIKIAAEGGDQRAQFWLWRYCGREKYREYLHRSASHGYCPALFILAQQCLRDVPVNTSEGLRLLRIGAVEKGDPSSQLELGCLLLEQGNSGEAFRLLKLASDQGLPEGQNALAVCYSQRTPFASGCCGERNDQEALRLWKLSADQGLAASQFMLGHCYMSGDIVPQDYESAAMYLSLAAKAEGIRRRADISPHETRDHVHEGHQCHTTELHPGS
ncbi:hypothetical protein Pelo_19336 [Pelomyxa schiedti]|nr:hypothetical protein Pelo_19336 [Pelomyxa schiedti]